MRHDLLEGIEAARAQDRNEFHVHEQLSAIHCLGLSSNHLAAFRLVCQRLRVVS
jgi:hypothetical protein